MFKIDTTTEASEENIEKLVDLLQEQSRQDHRQNQEEELKEDKTHAKEQGNTYLMQLVTFVFRHFCFKKLCRFGIDVMK